MKGKPEADTALFWNHSLALFSSSSCSIAPRAITLKQRFSIFAFFYQLFNIFIVWLFVILFGMLFFYYLNRIYRHGLSTNCMFRIASDFSPSISHSLWIKMNIFSIFAVGNCQYTQAFNSQPIYVSIEFIFRCRLWLCYFFSPRAFYMWLNGKGSVRKYIVALNIDFATVCTLKAVAESVF